MKNAKQAHLRSGIAGKIRALRWDRHWTQVELARKLGLSQGRYSEIERGQGSFTAEQFLEILKLFHVPVSHFTEPEKWDGPETANAPMRFGTGHLHESPTVLPSDLKEALGYVPKRSTGRSLPHSLEMDWD